MRLDGFGLFVDDMAKMIRFYKDVLGFGIKEEENTSNVYLIKDGTLFLLYGRNDFEKMTNRRYEYIKGLNGHSEIALYVDTFEEVEILHNRMKEAGVQNMSAYIRKMALNGYVIIPEWPDLNQVISLHSRISNNLNQYARKANETGKLYEEDITEIKKMHNEQTKFLKKILEAVMYLYEEDSKKKK